MSKQMSNHDFPEIDEEDNDDLDLSPVSSDYDEDDWDEDEVEEWDEPEYDDDSYDEFPDESWFDPFDEY